MWGVLLFAVGSTALGLHMWRLVWRYLRLRRTMRGWPRVPARVLGYRTRRGVSSGRIDVQVRFDYEGRELQVWCRSPTRSAYGRGAMQAEKQMAARFPRGTSQLAFVNPASPGEAFLELPEPHMLAMLAGGGMLLVALAAALALPAIVDVQQEIATLGFMLVVGGVLAVIAVFAAIALWRLPRP
jgi:hypothetical protein